VNHPAMLPDERRGAAAAVDAYSLPSEATTRAGLTKAQQALAKALAPDQE